MGEKSDKRYLPVTLPVTQCHQGVTDGNKVLIDVNKIEVDGRVNFKLTCLNLLKYRDEYTAKKSKKIGTKTRQNPDKLRSKKQIQI